MWKHIAIAVTFLLFGTPARAQQLLILCDTADQVELVFTLQAQGIASDQALDAANKQAKAVVCGFMVAEAKIIERVRDVPVNGISFTIVKVAVTGFFDGKQMLVGTALEQFAAHPSKPSREM